MQSCSNELIYERQRQSPTLTLLTNYQNPASLFFADFNVRKSGMMHVVTRHNRSMNFLTDAWCTASRRTCCKQIRWTLSVINLRPNSVDNASRRKSPIFQLPHLHLTYATYIWHLRWRWTRLTFAEIFGVIKLESWAIVWRCLRDPMFSRFSRTPTCDRRTDGPTDTWRQLIPALASVAMVIKSRSLIRDNLSKDCAVCWQDAAGLY